MIIRYTASRETEGNIIALLPASQRDPVSAAFAMEIAIYRAPLPPDDGRAKLARREPVQTFLERSAGVER